MAAVSGVRGLGSWLLVLAVFLDVARSQISRDPLCQQQTPQPGLDACNCDAGSDGSFLCLNVGTCVPLSLATFVCRCPFSFPGLQCEDNLRSCSTAADCPDSSFSCTAIPGSSPARSVCACGADRHLQTTGGTQTCTLHTPLSHNLPVNECVTGAANCDVNARCTDTADGFVCTCNSGFVGDGTQCADVNECTQRLHDCAPSGSRCCNKRGSFACSCAPGYRGDGRTCFPDGPTDGAADTGAIAGAGAGAAAGGVFRDPADSESSMELMESMESSD